MTGSSSFLQKNPRFIRPIRVLPRPILGESLRLGVLGD
jgi:hypothetical protein